VLKEKVRKVPALMRGILDRIVTEELDLFQAHESPGRRAAILLAFCSLDPSSHSYYRILQVIVMVVQGGGEVVSPR
jgi:hypothetical protein